LNNVRHAFPTGDGIRHITFSISPGEFVFLVGPSGAGKSTVLRLIYMDLLPDEGHIVVSEFNSLFMKRRDIPQMRRKLGIVFQDFRLFPDRDVF